MKEFIGLMDMILYDESIPKHVKQDVLKRVQDWFEAGKSLDDDYIKSQYEYLLRVKEATN